MLRRNDESGVSGTGIVLEGTIFHDGKCVISWYTNGGSIGIYESFDNFKRIHIDSHPTNKTIIIFETGETIVQE
jgi:hypothetical protein